MMVTPITPLMVQVVNPLAPPNGNGGIVPPWLQHPTVPLIPLPGPVMPPDILVPLPGPTE